MIANNARLTDRGAHTNRQRASRAGRQQEGSRVWRWRCCRPWGGQRSTRVVDSGVAAPD